MLDFLIEIKDALLEAVLSLLPLSPFKGFIESLGSIPYISYINWFIPIGTFVQIGVAWLSAISIFYALSIVLRWVKAIE